MFKRFIIILALIIGLLTVAGLSMTQETISLVDALAIVQTDYDSPIVEMSHDDDNACWAFTLEDGTEGCLSDTTGELVDIIEPEATPDAESTEEASEASEVSEASEPEAEVTPDPEATPEPEPTPTVSLEDALAAALEIFPTGEVNAIYLTTYNGSLVWVVELDDGSRSVIVEATSDGGVLAFGFTNDIFGEDSESSDSGQTGGGQTGGGQTGGGSESSGSESSGSEGSD